MAVKIRNTENFDTLRQAGGYYVDKTGFLEKLALQFIWGKSRVDRRWL